MKMEAANQFVTYGKIRCCCGSTEVTPGAGCGNMRTVWYGEFWLVGWGIGAIVRFRYAS